LSVILTQGFLIGLLIATVRLAVPLLYTALGEMFSEKAGLLNIGLEGIMTFGAVSGFFGAYLTKNPWMGMIAGIIGGVIINMIFAFATVSLKSDQIVNGMVITILAAGAASYLYRSVFGISGTDMAINGFKETVLPLLGQIPLLGEMLFKYTAPVYIAFLLVPVCYVVLYKTTFGLRLRSVGEYPQAADSLGINVDRMRYVAAILCGALGGLGGAYMSVAYMNRFVDNMVAGRGFIALAAVIFGNWKPGQVMVACLLFGFADALQLRLQAIGLLIPYQFLVMLPYLLTLIAIAGVVGKTVGPAAVGQPYHRGK
jgi:simple sugar transport system permease protein